MTDQHAGIGWLQRGERMMNRVHARRAVRDSRAERLALLPEPRSIGTVERGRQLVAGSFLFAGALVEAPGTSPWDLPVPTPRFAAAVHGFRWLDDLAALGTDTARARAQDWTQGWIARFGQGADAGWEVPTAGRRAIRLVNHAAFLLRGQSAEVRQALLVELSAHALFLSRRWTHAPAGVPRIEALTGLIHVAAAVKGQDRALDPALKALARECGQAISAEGGVASRSPEDLLEAYALLVWSAQAALDGGRTPPAELEAVITRTTPVLLALRHADGKLARFHGGGHGPAGRLDQLIGATGLRPGPHPGRAMGFARLAGGRTTLILDAAPPPGGAASVRAHASTLAFELTSGRRPLVVNCGPGASFGETWGRTARATRSHSTLGLDGISSSRLDAVAPGAVEELRDRPTEVRLQETSHPRARGLVASHDGYVASHGLTHTRQLTLSRDGRELDGEDMIGALTPQEHARLAAQLGRAGRESLPVSIRFHLHPDVAVQPGGEDGAILLRLPSGELWEFRAEGGAQPVVAASVYLEVGRLKPTATKQIVLSGAVGQTACQINWTLAKSRGTPLAIRDTVRKDDESPPQD